MQNNLKLRQDDCQEISKLKCQVTETKINMKDIYDTNEYEAGILENENKKHMGEAIVINHKVKLGNCSQVPARR